MTTGPTGQKRPADEAARDLETDESEESFDRILKKVARSNPREAADRRAVEEAKAARARKIANAPPKMQAKAGSEVSAALFLVLLLAGFV
jgi:hypothetical protein